MGSFYESHGSTAVITLDNPPINSLGLEHRSRISKGLKEALADDRVRAIVLIGSRGVFTGGADIREFNTPQALAEPSLPTLIDAFEDSPKPVIAAIAGVCMGGGVELALGCHFRVALADAQIALPEVKLGLLPGAGGTQRLPRLVGPELALKIIVTGDAVPAQNLRDSGLFDLIVDGNLFEAALRLAEQVISEKSPIRRTRTIVAQNLGGDAIFHRWKEQARAQSPNFPAPLKCIEAVEAAFALPVEQGLSFERQIFMELLQTNESKALRHAFFGERAAVKVKDLPEASRIRTIQQVGVVGGGTMGTGIAMNFLNAGIPVVLLEMKQDALDRCLGMIRKTYESAVKKGKLKIEQLETQMNLLTPTLSYESFQDVDLIIEAVFESMAVKEQVFRKIDAVAKAGAILASNTSTLDIDRIASFTKRPADVLGLHFFSPAHVMKLLEVVRGAKTSAEVLASAMNIAKTIKKTAVVSGVCDGFIGNRMIAAYSQQATNLLEEGALPEEVDRALEEFGMAMGPFRMSDLAGNDIGWAIRKHQQLTQPDPQYPRIADRLCELGRFGQKTGAGWYQYTAGSREAFPDSRVKELIDLYRSEKGLQLRQISQEEVVDRCILALVNEGAKILEENIAQRASDIDVVYLSGYGFPLYRGGPLFYADTRGLRAVIERMAQFLAKSGDSFWKPAALLSELAAKGLSFNSPP